MIKSAQTSATHQHCPKEHEHPQPFMLDGKNYCGKNYCGKYWQDDDLLVEMIDCNDEIC